MDYQIGILKSQKDNMDILEAIDVLVMQPDLKIQSNDELFNKMANLIIGLERSEEHTSELQSLS